MKNNSRIICTTHNIPLCPKTSRSKYFFFSVQFFTFFSKKNGNMATRNKWRTSRVGNGDACPTLRDRRHETDDAILKKLRWDHSDAPNGWNVLLICFARNWQPFSFYSRFPMKSLEGHSGKMKNNKKKSYFSNVPNFSPTLVFLGAISVDGHF